MLLKINISVFQRVKIQQSTSVYVPTTCEENPNEYLFSVEINDKVATVSRLRINFQVILFPI